MFQAKRLFVVFPVITSVGIGYSSINSEPSQSAIWNRDMGCGWDEWCEKKDKGGMSYWFKDSTKEFRSTNPADKKLKSHHNNDHEVAHASPIIKKPTSLLALSPTEFRPFVLASTEKISNNTTRQKFLLPSKEHETGLTVASCIVVKAEIDGKTVIRPYTPISLNEQRGFIELLIKSYPSPGGLMSRHIQKLKPNIDSLEMKGPFKKLEYKANMKKKIGMIAGGTGVTPMLQVIREVLSNPDDITQVSLIFANVSEGDILLREELDALEYLYPNFRVYYTVDKDPKKNTWKGGVGFVNLEMISEHLPNSEEDCLILVCGPKGMMQHVSGNKADKDVQGELDGLLKEAGFKANQVYKF